VPGSDARKLETALASTADEVVIDLEDAVAPHAKNAARAQVVTVLSQQTLRDPGGIAVRVNAPRTPWCHADLLAVAALDPPPGSIVLPKTESPGDVEFVDRLLDGAQPSGVRSTAVQALIETPTGLAAARDIARAGERLESLVLGYADLAASLGMTGSPVELAELWLPFQSALLVAARTAGLQAVDGPYLGVEDDDGFRSAVARAAALVFDGKWAIHPRQLGAVTRLLSPSAAQVEEAERVLAALDQAARETDAGAVALDGRMLDEAVAAAARRVLARRADGASATEATR
jgi:citrate lyase subunit beta/citryl-CoA lyase